jgi:hypothetical protein
MPTTDAFTTTSAAELRDRLSMLECERAGALLDGVAGSDLYMADLLGEIADVRAAYAGAAVTEIASLRAALGAPLAG